MQSKDPAFRSLPNNRSTKIALFTTHLVLIALSVGTWLVASEPMVRNLSGWSIAVAGLGSVTAALALTLFEKQLKRWQMATQSEWENKIRDAQVISLGEMAAGIAHEVNNPLSIVTGMTHGLGRKLKSHTESDPSLKNLIDNLNSATFRIADIVKSLRRFARADDDHSVEIVPLSKILQETLNLCRTRVDREHVKLQLEYIPRSISIECAPSLVSKVIYNLIMNALDAVSSVEDKWIRISLIDEGDQIVLAVTDSGIGVPSEARHRIFHPFFTTKEIGSGTGLGLSQSLGICLDHSGSLTLTEHQKHTSFVITLPKRQPDAKLSLRRAA